MRLKDRIALVTGAGSGIGRAIALRFAGEGARVVVNDVKREAAEDVARGAGGAIVNMSSIAALSGLEAVPHYSAAKGGILSFTRAVAREVASRNIRVNAICPGFIDTPMTERMSDLMRRAVLTRTPLGRWGEP